MTDCEDIMSAVLRGAIPSAAETAHVAACARCSEAIPGAEALARALAADPTPPPPGLGERVVRAVDPILAGYRQEAASQPAEPSVGPARGGEVRRAGAITGAMAIDWRRLAAALAPALLVLPLVVAADFFLLRTAHAVLGSLLPGSLTTYLVGSYAALLTVLVAATFAAIPFLVQQQAAPWKEGHV